MLTHSKREIVHRRQAAITGNRSFWEECEEEGVLSFDSTCCNSLQPKYVLESSFTFNYWLLPAELKTNHKRERKSDCTWAVADSEKFCHFPEIRSVSNLGSGLDSSACYSCIHLWIYQFHASPLSAPLPWGHDDEGSKQVYPGGVRVSAWLLWAPASSFIRADDSACSFSSGLIQRLSVIMFGKGYCKL